MILPFDILIYILALKIFKSPHVLKEMLKISPNEIKIRVITPWDELFEVESSNDLSQ